MIGKAATPRGPREDVITLTVSKAVDPGMYFVLLQSVGGTLPYQLTAHLAPGEGACSEGRRRQRRCRLRRRRLARRDDSSRPPDTGLVRAGYDPAVPFSKLRTFSFRTPEGSDDEQRRGPPGKVDRRSDASSAKT